MCPDTLIPATVQAASPALHDQRALYCMCDTVFARLDKVGFASHRCNGNFGEGWTGSYRGLSGRGTSLSLACSDQVRVREQLQCLPARAARPWLHRGPDHPPRVPLRPRSCSKRTWCSGKPPGSRLHTGTNGVASQHPCRCVLSSPNVPMTQDVVASFGPSTLMGEGSGGDERLEDTQVCTHSRPSGFRPALRASTCSGV
jgi:hypothetical protein